MSRTKAAEVFYWLAAEFEPWEVKKYPVKGKPVVFVSRATVENRLDTVLGPENWSAQFEERPGGVYCHLSIKILGDAGELIEATKHDFGGFPKGDPSSTDPKEASKNLEAGYTKSLKRAAEQFGVARYLKKDGIPGYFADQDLNRYPAPSLPPPGVERDRPREQDGRQAPRDRGDDRRPSDRPNGQQAAPAASQAPQQGNGSARVVPRNGKELFGWVKDQGIEHEINLLQHVNTWGKAQGFPTRIVDWSDLQTQRGHAEACRKLSAYEDALAN